MNVLQRNWFGLALSVLSLYLLALYSYRASENISASSFWVDHTYEVASQLDAAITQFDDAETGQRGYLLTGDPKYLEPYQNSASKINATLAKTKALTIDNPSQQQRLNRIELLSIEKLAELQETINIYGAGHPNKAIEIVMTHRGKQVMDDIRAEIDEMRGEEEKLLALRLQESKSALRRAILIGSLGGILVLSIIVINAVIISNQYKRHISRSNQAELEADNVIQQLEQSLSEFRPLPDTLSVCSYCKAVRNEENVWEKLESFLSTHIDVTFSHGICTKCLADKSWR